ncbi:hypothetical protein A0H81_06990 [Grifola frondosa]|uniref:Uncharacterized protein n=1 Tax=Grifola frondosa TaxID=5627 RepID=A0A1C7MDN0_GRIFR|nr:hypothetical protein A0H81_06990 [Grifola frondosa]
MGKLANVEKIIKHCFTLQDTTRAFELLAKGRDDDGNIPLVVRWTARAPSQARSSCTPSPAPHHALPHPD